MTDAYRAHLQQRLDDFAVPSNLHDGLISYLVERRAVGGFLTAVLSNDLTQTVARADPETGQFLRQIVRFLLHTVPSSAWGSPAAVQAWLDDPSPAPEIFE